MCLHKLAQTLRKNNLTIATAESCTGGLLAHTLTNIAGSSAYFRLGIIAYCAQSKQRLLQIPQSYIKKHTEVSAIVACLMAEHIRKRAETDIGLATTGYAGPGGGTRKNPIGTVYIAVSVKQKTRVVCQRFRGSRLTIKQQATRSAIELTLRCLNQQ